MRKGGRKEKGGVPAFVAKLYATYGVWMITASKHHGGTRRLGSNSSTVVKEFCYAMKGGSPQIRSEGGDANVIF
jgi:hypothetical protein